MTRKLVAALAVITLVFVTHVWAQSETGSSSSTGSTYGSASTSGTGTTAQSDPAATTTTTTTTTAPSNTTSTTQSTMPKTAGPWPLLALMGFGALGGGTLLKRVRR